MVDCFYEAVLKANPKQKQPQLYFQMECCHVHGETRCNVGIPVMHFNMWVSHFLLQGWERHTS